MPKKAIALVLGIRPDVIRASMIIRKLDESSLVDLKFIWSGQHYSDNMKDVFFRELNVRRPDIELNAKGNSDAELVGNIIHLLYNVLDQLRPEATVFLGDTNTVAGCLAPAQLNIPIYHIEGCMRSYDWTMPEEKYRTMIDHLSDVIYAYLPKYRDNGILEGIYPGRIVLTGNPIVDVIEEYFISRRDNEVRNSLLKKYNVSHQHYCVMTCHRRENIDEKKYLQNIVSLAASSKIPTLFFAGYRTQRRLTEFGIQLGNTIHIYDPVGYYDLLYLMESARLVLTDSGTVVEETCILGTPSIQIRFSTERPEVYEVGSSVRFNPRESIDAPRLARVLEDAFGIQPKSWHNPFGDGKSSERIAGDIVSRLGTSSSLGTHDVRFTTSHIERAVRW